MDKQKQIEEMAKDICGKYNNDGCEIDGYICNLRCDSRIRAEICYDLGYRKIRENEVVLTREEKDEIINFLVKRKVQYFAERVKMAFYYEFDELIPSIMADKIDEICNETINTK
jgi:hypothetical protein